MPEKEPLYFKEFRLNVDKRFDLIDQKFESIGQKFELIDKRFNSTDEKFESIDQRFELIDKRFESLDQNIYELTISTATSLRNIDFRFDSLENELTQIRESMFKIEAHIGRYEVRSTNIENILLEDFKPRITALEKAYLAS